MNGWTDKDCYACRGSGQSHAEGFGTAMCRVCSGTGKEWGEVDEPQPDPGARRIEEPSAARAARDVAPGESWAFTDHRTLAEVYREGN